LEQDIKDGEKKKDEQGWNRIYRTEKRERMNRVRTGYIGRRREKG